MNFDSALALKAATGRAKSDVANKLVSMFLHEISRRACLAGAGSVASPSYHEAVVQAFGHRCLYCCRDLEHDRASVEHLDGMNRFRGGLHIPGNVAVSCKRCNNEKRRDDQKTELSLANTGWESFLSHDGTRCPSTCRSCFYWAGQYADAPTRTAQMKAAITRIHDFRLPFADFIQWSETVRPAVQKLTESLYRSCQNFATTQIDQLTAELDFDFSALKRN
ncbi:MAG: hypothetical protein V4672_06070 [Verrucomicrobiota bacterium]